MIIFSKQKKALLNTEKFDAICIEDEDDGDYHNGCMIRAYGSASGNFNWFNLAEYKTPKRAQEVLRQIFIAMTDNLKTFEMPED